MAAFDRKTYKGNVAYTATLATGIAAGDVTIPLTDGTTFPDGSAGPYCVTIDPGNPGEEKVKIASRSGNTLTVAASGRGYDGTTAASHVSGVKVFHTLSAVDLDEANQAVVALLGAGAAPAGFGIPVYNVKNPAYGAKGDGATDDTTAIQNAINAASAASPVGAVFFPPGQYVINAALTVGPIAAGSAVPVAYPSLIGLTAAGRIGDVGDAAAVEIICGTSFPVGTFALQVIAPNANVAPTGSWARGFSLRCNARGAGIYIEQPRRFHWEDITIDGAAQSSTNPNGATGAFSVVARTGTAGAYNRFVGITTALGAQDGFYHGSVDDSVFSDCFDLSSARYAYNAAGQARWVNCHYEASTRGWNVACGNVQNTLIGCDYFGIPTDVGIAISSGWGGSGTNSPLLAIGCRFACQPTVASPNATVALCTSGVVALAEFVGCDFQAVGTHAAWFVISSAVAGSVLNFIGCTFGGAPTSGNVSDQHATVQIRSCPGINPLAGNIAPVVPATGVAAAATYYDRTFYVTAGAGGATTMTIQNGAAVVIPASAMGTVRVPAGKTVTPTYASAPTWVAEGE